MKEIMRLSIQWILEHTENLGYVGDFDDFCQVIIFSFGIYNYASVETQVETTNCSEGRKWSGESSPVDAVLDEG